MQYRFAGRGDYSYLASGNVLKHFTGMPCFPVRLTLELFGRAKEAVGRDRLRVYDPCAGSGFSLSAMGIAMQREIEAIYASDVDPACVEAARCNTSLLSREGLAAARERLADRGASAERLAQYDEAAAKILPLLAGEPPRVTVFRHDILASTPSLPEPVDFLFADLPYGIMTEWQTDAAASDPAERFFENIVPLLAPGGVAAVAGRKDLRPPAGMFRKLDRISAGHRLVWLLRPAE
ncbi:MAG: hypothetical protein II836_00955 [Clostridia bacterium]|nr:hypothetical protein [Clostridia bacterium]MBQ3814596.1 hypothetical protein [Clostridia bacterium]MBR4186222.1 hypothetical protein [Clostridia bacterium]